MRYEINVNIYNNKHSTVLWEAHWPDGTNNKSVFFKVFFTVF